jgi:deferrochelatase/peroxidase EfeB
MECKKMHGMDNKIWRHTFSWPKKQADKDGWYNKGYDMLDTQIEQEGYLMIFHMSEALRTPRKSMS